MHWLTEALSHDHAKEAQGRSERVECVWEALACSPPCTNTNGDPCARRAVTDQNPAGRIASTSLVLWSACGQQK